MKPWTERKLRLAELGEEKAMEKLLELLRPQWRCPSLEHDDDAACIGEKYPRLLMKIDGYAVKRSLLPWMTLEDLGWKSVTAAASDLVAKGGKPLAFVISVGLEPSTSLEDLLSIVRGAVLSSRAHGAWLAGGDTNSAEDPWIDVAGVAYALKVVGRRPKRGDVVYVTTGRWGLTAMAFHFMARDWEEAIKRYPRTVEETRRPVARLGFAEVVGQIGDSITASSDSSDGLAYTLLMLSRKAGAPIVLESPPVEDEALEYAREHGLSPLELALYGGEEYEVVFTVKPADAKDVEYVAESLKLRIARVGVVAEEPGEPGLVLRGGRLKVSRWDQFKGFL